MKGTSFRNAGIILLQGIMLLALMTGSLQSQIIKPDLSDTNQLCGQKINTRDVMVLDLEPFGDDLETADQFARKHAGDYLLINGKVEHITTRWSHALYDRDSGIKRAQKEAAKRGCNLVLVMEAGVYTDKSIGTDPKGNVATYYRDTGYAYVLMGSRAEALAE